MAERYWLLLKFLFCYHTREQCTKYETCTKCTSFIFCTFHVNHMMHTLYERYHFNMCWPSHTNEKNQMFALLKIFFKLTGVIYPTPCSSISKTFGYSNEDLQLLNFKMRYCKPVLWPFKNCNRLLLIAMFYSLRDVFFSLDFVVCWLFKTNFFFKNVIQRHYQSVKWFGSRSGLWSAEVECLTRDRGTTGSSLTGVTALCPWARHINPSLVLV